MAPSAWARLVEDLSRPDAQAEPLIRRCLACWSRASGPIHVLHPWFSGGPWPEPKGNRQRMVAPRLLLHLGGTVEFHHGGPMVIPAPGDVFVIPGHATTSEHSEKGYVNLLVCPRMEGVYAQLAVVPGTNPPPGCVPMAHGWSDPRGGRHIAAILQLLTGATLPEAVAQPTSLTWLAGLRQLLTGLLDHPAESQVALGPPAIRVALDLIARHHADHAFSVARLAALMGMHQVVLARLLRRYTGRSTRLHLEEVRLAHAERLLADPGCKISTAAREAGFGSARHLRIAFSRTHGGPPSIKRIEAHRA